MHTCVVSVEGCLLARLKRESHFDKIIDNSGVRNNGFDLSDNQYYVKIRKNI
jgi:hypothetical protein